MSDPGFTGAPAVQPPAVDPAAGQQQQEQLPPIHPAWDKAMAAIPDVLRGPLVEQIRATDRESQLAIEQARANATPEEWRSLMADAAAAQVSPTDLVAAYQNAQAIRQDPVGFVIQLTDLIDQRMALPATDPNHLTTREGYRMKQDAAAGVQQLTGQQQLDDQLQTPEARELAEMKTRFEKFEQETAAERTQRAQQEQQNAAAASQREAEQFAQQFLSTLDTKMAGAADGQKNIVATVANSLIQGDQTGRLTADQAIDFAIKSARDNGMVWQAAVAAAAPQQQAAPPVGAGTQQLPAQQQVAPVTAPPGSPQAKQQMHDKMMAAATATMALPGEQDM